LLPDIAQLSDSLLAQSAAVRPVAQSVAYDLTTGGILARFYGLADEGDHLRRKGDADFLYRRHL
jgi:hypothetical protein